MAPLTTCRSRTWRISCCSARHWPAAGTSCSVPPTCAGVGTHRRRQIRRQHAALRHVPGDVRQPSRGTRLLHRSADDTALNCMAQYQRSWFHLLLGESYLSRIDTCAAYGAWLARSSRSQASTSWRSFREYALRLMDGTSAPANVETLSRVTAAIKLRISLHAQSTVAAIRSLDETAAAELGFLGRQPTSDERILRSIRAASM